jgi:hypothetical protein
MKRNLIAVLAVLAANAAVAMPDLDGDSQHLQSTPETTSYVAAENYRRDIHEFVQAD